ncbi:signal peptidase II [uncultured Pseudokineococcus sp.]|uniref:signal peptidase II n=1 Tax=uncultured Pseudokineococcus sp. TaxID=1642928 RepID=UPI0026356D58|nr:signal peptidase II [uncultured Pseudokineococcus sp.]
MAVVALVWGLDQLTKVLAVDRLVEGEPVELVPGVLDLYLLYNPGAAFSLATGLTWVLTLVAVAVVVAVALMARRLGSRAWALTLGLLLGGALGNLTDRLLREPGFGVGHVVDFLRLPRWPVFNLADTAIVVAAVLVVVLSFRGIGVDGRRDGAEQVEREPDPTGRTAADGDVPPAAGTAAPREAPRPPSPGEPSPGEPSPGEPSQGEPSQGEVGRRG